MSVIIKKVTDFYKKDECSKYYKLGKTLGTYVSLYCTYIYAPHSVSSS